MAVNHQSIMIDKWEKSLGKKWSKIKESKSDRWLDWYRRTWEQIKAEDILKYTELQKDIVWALSQYKTQAESNSKKKHKLFVERERARTKPEVFDTNHIKEYLLHQHIKAATGTYYDSWLNVEYTGEEWILDQEQAQVFAALAKNRKKVMQKDKKDMKWLDNVLFYGCGIEWKTWYDKNADVLTYEVVNPKYWMPDPQGDVLTNKFLYHILSTKSTIEELVYNPKLFNLQNLTTSYKDPNWTATDATRYLSSSEWNDNFYQIYNWSVQIGKWKYRCALSNDNGNIIFREPIQPINQEERNDPSKIPHDVNVTNLFSLEGDPFGMWYAELILSFQNAKNRLNNYAIIKEQRYAGFGNYLVDNNIIPDIDMLLERSEKWPIFVPTDNPDWAPLSNAIAPVQEEWADGSTLNIADRIDVLAGNQTWQTSMNRWASPGAETLWQSKIMAVNSNISFMIDMTNIWFGYERFWKNFFNRSLVENRPTYKEIWFNMGEGLMTRKVKLKKPKFLYGQNLDVRVYSKALRRQKREEEILYMREKLQNLMVNPNTPEFSKKYFQRKYDELNGMDMYDIELANRTDPSERHARGIVELLNRDIEVKNPFRPWMDLKTMYVIINEANDSEQKTKILAQLDQLMIDEWLTTPQQVEGEWFNMNNSMNAAITNNNIQRKQQNTDVPTKADLMQ